jgi:hypothetical protein
MASAEPLVRAILGTNIDANRERRLRALLKEDARCAEYIRRNAGLLRSKLAPLADYEDFLDLFVEVVWASLFVKAGAEVHPIRCEPGQRTPEYRVVAPSAEFHAESRRLREPGFVEVGPPGPIRTYTFSAASRGAEFDNVGARRISDAILDKLGQLRDGSPNVLLFYTSAFGVTPMFYNDALRLVEHVSDDFLVARGYASREAFISEVNRISAIAYREEGRAGQNPRNIVTRNGTASQPLPQATLDWLAVLDFSATGAGL